MAIQNEIIPLGSPFLGLFALVPLYVAVRNANSYIESALLTGLQVMCVHLMSSFWLGFFRDYAIFTLGASALGTGIIGMCVGCYLHYPMLQTKTEKSGLYTNGSCVAKRILMFAAIWTLYEWVKSVGFLAYPWGTLVMTSYKWSLITQIVDITGTWGISFLFSLFSALVAEGLALIPVSSKSLQKNMLWIYSKCGALCIILFLVTGIYGAIQYNITRIPKDYMQTVLVQQDSDPWESTDEECVTISAALTEKGVQEAIDATKQKPDLVVWSEAVLSYSFPQALSYYEHKPSSMPLIPFIKKTGVPFIIGAPVTIDREKRKFANSAIYFDSDGQYIDYYAKMHLVPFAEIIPGADSPLVQKLLKKVVGISSGWTPGTEVTLFEIPLHSGKNVEIGLPICFEDAFPDVCRAMHKAGCEVFVNLTNDSWSRTASAQYQHFAIASFRAIEYRTTMVRSTNSGYSVVINPVGKVIADMPLFEKAVLYTPVPIYHRQHTIYSILGDWIPAICGICVVVFIVINQIKEKKNEHI